MTQDPVTDACHKFLDYLQANGHKPMAMVLSYEADTNTREIVRIGFPEFVDETCIAAMAHSRGIMLRDQIRPIPSHSVPLSNVNGTP